jgi:hypothetical protein
MVSCTLLLLGLGLGLYTGWARYFRLRVEREQWAVSGKAVERAQRERAALSAALIPGGAVAQPTLADAAAELIQPANTEGGNDAKGSGTGAVPSAMVASAQQEWAWQTLRLRKPFWTDLLLQNLSLVRCQTLW